MGQYTDRLDQVVATYQTGQAARGLMMGLGGGLGASLLAVSEAFKAVRKLDAIEGDTRTAFDASVAEAMGEVDTSSDQLGQVGKASSSADTAIANAVASSGDMPGVDLSPEQQNLVRNAASGIGFAALGPAGSFTAGMAADFLLGRNEQAREDKARQILEDLKRDTQRARAEIPKVPKNPKAPDVPDEEEYVPTGPTGGIGGGSLLGVATGVAVRRGGGGGEVRRDYALEDDREREQREREQRERERERERLREIERDEDERERREREQRERERAERERERAERERLREIERQEEIERERQRQLEEERRRRESQISIDGGIGGRVPGSGGLGGGLGLGLGSSGAGGVSGSVGGAGGMALAGMGGAALGAIMAKRAAAGGLGGPGLAGMSAAGMGTGAPGSVVATGGGAAAGGAGGRPMMAGGMMGGGAAGGQSGKKKRRNGQDLLAMQLEDEDGAVDLGAIGRAGSRRSAADDDDPAW